MYCRSTEITLSIRKPVSVKFQTYLGPDRSADRLTHCWVAVQELNFSYHNMDEIVNNMALGL